LQKGTLNNEIYEFPAIGELEIKIGIIKEPARAAQEKIEDFLLKLEEKIKELIITSIESPESSEFDFVNMNAVYLTFPFMDHQLCWFIKDEMLALTWMGSPVSQNGSLIVNGELKKESISNQIVILREISKKPLSGIYPQP